jgi:hypothetical protein
MRLDNSTGGTTVKIELTKERLIALKPCNLNERLKLFDNASTITVSAALAAGVSVSDILWVAGAMGFGMKCAEFAIKCAESVMHKNSDPRVKVAIEAAKLCVKEPNVENRRAAYAAAYAAARAAYGAYAAARAAYAADAAARAAYAAADAAYAAANAAADAAADAAYAAADAAARAANAASAAANAAAYAARAAANAANAAANQKNWLIELFEKED